MLVVEAIEITVLLLEVEIGDGHHDGGLWRVRRDDCWWFSGDGDGGRCQLRGGEASLGDLRV